MNNVYYKVFADDKCIFCEMYLFSARMKFQKIVKSEKEALLLIKDTSPDVRKIAKLRLEGKTIRVEKFIF